MKKIISLALSLIMILSMVTVCFAAAPTADSVGTVASGYKPEGTAIDSLEDITDPAGKYYLEKDITVSTTYAELFTGTLDGNGKTVTVSAPMFAQFGGTVLNLTIKGTIAAPTEAAHSAAIAVLVPAENKATFKNVKSEAKIDGWVGLGSDGKTEYVDGKRPSVAALAGYVEGNDITVENCFNTGAINGYTAAGLVGQIKCAGGNFTFKNSGNSGAISNTGSVQGSSTGSGGGILGHSDNGVKGIFDNCINAGSVNCVNAGNSVGGMCGYFYASKAAAKEETDVIKAINCVNTGAITGVNAGGMFGDIRVAATVENCVNTGTLTASNRAGGMIGAVAAQHDNGVAYVIGCTNTGVINAKQGGGIVGYGWANKTTQWIDVQNCLNTAEITVSEWGSQLVAYTNSENTTIKNNLAVGSLKASADAANLVVVGHSSAKGADYQISGNYYIENDGTKYLTFTKTADNPVIEFAARAEGTVVTATSAQIASGDVVKALNTAIGSTVFYMNGSAPSLTPPAADPAPSPSNPSTGDATVVIVLALVAVSAGAVLTLKKRQSVR